MITRVLAGRRCCVKVSLIRPNREWQLGAVASLERAAPHAEPTFWRFGVSLRLGPWMLGADLFVRT